MIPYFFVFLFVRLSGCQVVGIPEHKLNEIKIIVEKYADNFKEQFRQHIGKRIDD